jgi:hypothetical protein
VREAAANDSLQKLNVGISNLHSVIQMSQEETKTNQTELFKALKTSQEISQKQQTEFAEKVNSIVGGMNRVSDTINVNMNQVIVQFEKIQEKTINAELLKNNQTKLLNGKSNVIKGAVSGGAGVLVMSAILFFGWEFGYKEKSIPLNWSDDLGEMKWDKAIEKCIEMDKRLPFQKEILSSFNRNDNPELKGAYWVTFESDPSLEQYTINLNNDETKSYSIKKKNSAKVRCVGGL